jgi:hypothetical protein
MRPQQFLGKGRGNSEKGGGKTGLPEKPAAIGGRGAIHEILPAGRLPKRPSFAAGVKSWQDKDGLQETCNP